MFPRAPQLWQPHHNGKVVGVSDDPPGETYWKVKNGLRLTGMPAFDKVLNDQQIWQVSLLMANADKPLPLLDIAGPTKCGSTDFAVAGGNQILLLERNGVRRSDHYCTSGLSTGARSGVVSISTRVSFGNTTLWPVRRKFS